MLICGRGDYRTSNNFHGPEYFVFSNRTVDGEQEQYEEVTLHVGKVPLYVIRLKFQLLCIQTDLQDVMCMKYEHNVSPPLAAKSDQCGKWKQVFAGKTIDSSHLDLGDSLGEGIPTFNFFDYKSKFCDDGLLI